MTKLLAGVGAVSLVALPASLPTATNAQSARELPDLCQDIVDNGGGGYRSAGDCVSEIRGLPVERCNFIKLYLGFPALVPDESGNAVLVRNQGDCIAHFRKHGGAR